MNFGSLRRNRFGAAAGGPVLPTRRSLLGALAASAVTCAAGERKIALLDDPRFERGLRVWSPQPGAKVEQGIVRASGAAEQPAWGVAQWHSRFSLAQAKREALPSGSVQFFDGAKAVTFGAAGSPEADLVLALNGRTEYGDHPPDKGEAWPHLLVEQPLRPGPPLADLRAVPFRIAFHLLRSTPYRSAGWNDQRHTAQFLLYITVQNRNTRSPGFGDFLWFGVPMYDARYRLPRRHAAMDMSTPKKKGTGKFIFNPGGERYTTVPAIEGNWISIDADLLPLMREALEAAWNAGFLPASRDLADYRLGSINCGWEVTGPWDVAMQIRGLSLEAASLTA